MKKILYILLGLILLVAISIGALVTFVNPNQFKPLLTEQVKKMTGRELVINGDISWRFFPTLGLSVGDTAFRNPNGFSEPNLVQFKQAQLSVSVWPLLSHELNIGEMRLDGAHVFIQTLKTGVTNLDGLTNKTEANSSSAKKINNKTEDKSSTATTDKATPWKISLAGIKLVDASVDVRNEQTNMIAQLQKVNFTLDSFAPQAWTKASFDLQGKVNELVFSAKGETDLKISQHYDNIELKSLSSVLTAKDGNNELKHAQVNIDQFTLGQWANVTLNIDGNIPDLAFNTQGQAQVKLSQNHELVSIQNVTLTNDLTGKLLPHPKMNVVVNTDATYDLIKKMASVNRLTIDADGTKISGSGSYLATTIPVIRFALASDNINVDHWLPVKTAPVTPTSAATDHQTAVVTSTVTSSHSLSKQEPDLSAFKHIDVAGMVAIKQLTAANATISNAKVVMSVKNGVVNINSFNADLYDGVITGNASINTNTTLPTYHLKNTITNIELQPLLKAVANNQLLAGRATMNTDLSGKGLSAYNLRHNITGSVDVRLVDGAVYGVNVADLLRNAKAKLKGKVIDDGHTEKKTDFSRLTATLVLKHGIANINDFHLSSPLLAINGQGKTDLITESIDATVSTAVVASGKGLDDLKGVAVPISISGTWQQPKYRLNIRDLFKNNIELENKAKKEINRGLEKLFGDKAKDENIKNVADKLLNGLFN